MQLPRLLRLTLLFVCLCAPYAVPGQNRQLDPAFAPAVSKSGTAIADLLIQPDGKIIFYGDFAVVNGTLRFSIVRVDADGVIDPSFQCTRCETSITSALLQPDGRILIVERAPGSTAQVLRLNADGSVDTSFNFGLSIPAGANVKLLAVQPDGKIYVAVEANGPNLATSTLYRLNPNGSSDAGFTGFTVDLLGQGSLGVKALGDGRVFVYGNTPYGYIAQLNADGTKSSAFESPSLSYSMGQLLPEISDIAFQSDGKMVVIGRFDLINGISRSNVARLNSNSSVDTTYTADVHWGTGTFGGGQLQVISGDWLYIDSNALDGTVMPKIVRLNSDGTRDEAFAMATQLNILGPVAVDPLDRVYTYSLVPAGNGFEYRWMRFGNDGVLDTSFGPTTERQGSVTAAAESGGKVVIAGDFNRIDGITRNTIARFNADGSLDTTFDPGSGFDGAINTVAIQGDGKILVGGSFTRFRDVNRQAIARLNVDGQLDDAFDPVLVSVSGSTVYSIAVQVDGKILVGGIFDSVNSTPRNGFARLENSGSTDVLFAPILGGATIRSIYVEQSGKIMVGGTFNGANGFNRSNLARFETGGSLDTTFNATVGPVSGVIRSSDGKYAVIAGTVRKLTATGSSDPGFTPPVLPGGATINTIAAGPSGSVVLGGEFATLNGLPHRNVARIYADGHLDRLYLQDGTNRVVRTLAAQADGKIVIGGDFTKINGTTRVAAARVNALPLRAATPFDFDGDGVADISVTRLGNSYVWYQLLGSNFTFSATQFGRQGDIAAPADFDGDGITDIAVFRPNGGIWWYRSSRDGSEHAFQWGAVGDIPLPSDADGDDVDDFVVYRPQTNRFYRHLSRSGSVDEIHFGIPGDKIMTADLDGDGKADPIAFRPSTGVFWYVLSSTGLQGARQWGAAGDIPVPADFDGDGKTDFAIFRPSNGGWYIVNSSTGSITIVGFGLSGDRPIAADYDGDGKADIAVFRPSNGVWYLLGSTAGFSALQWGIAGDVPSPGAFVP